MRIRFSGRVRRMVPGLFSFLRTQYSKQTQRLRLEVSFVKLLSCSNSETGREAAAAFLQWTVCGGFPLFVETDLQIRHDRAAGHSLILSIFFTEKSRITKTAKAAAAMTIL